MNKILSYLVVALLTCVITFWYATSCRIPNQNIPSNQSKIAVYPVTQFFKLHTFKLIDSAALAGELKQNLELLNVLEENQNNTINKIINLPCGLSPGCYVPIFAIGCSVCACCNPFDLHKFSDPGPYEKFNFASLDNSNFRIYNKGQEIKLVSNLVGDIRIFEVPANTIMDQMTLNISGKTIGISK